MQKKRVVITGAGGLIGKEALEPLENSGFEVFCLKTKECNLFDYEAVENYFQKIKPEYLLHFAWFTGEGYLESELNTQYVNASLNMLKSFKENGGQRAIFTGTCFEYEFKNTPLKENDKLNPKTLYAKSKCELHEKAEIYCKNNNISFGWGRIFYVFGHKESEKRLTGAILKKLRNNERVEVNCGQLIKDYVYTKDIARAFVKFLDSNIEGCVNICTGKGIFLETFAKKIAKAMNKEELLKIEYKETSQPPMIIGDNTRLLKEVGFQFKYSFEEAIERIIKDAK